jgi:hypothetical protein
MSQFKNENDQRLAKRVWHSFVWKVKPSLSWIESILNTLENTRIHRPRRLRTSQAFMAWFKWLLKRIIRDGRLWQERFQVEFNHRLDGRRLKTTLKRIEDAEEAGELCPLCAQVWVFGDTEHNFANWVWRKYDAWREDNWQHEKQSVSKKIASLWNADAENVHSAIYCDNDFMSFEDEALVRQRIRAELTADGYLPHDVK